MWSSASASTSRAASSRPSSTRPRALDRGSLAIDLLDALDRELDAWLAAPASIAARLAPYDMLRGRAVVLEDGSPGTAAGIEPDGRLRVDCAGAIKLTHAGEVRIA